METSKHIKNPKFELNSLANDIVCSLKKLVTIQSDVADKFFCKTDLSTETGMQKAQYEIEEFSIKSEICLDYINHLINVANELQELTESLYIEVAAND